MTIEEIDAKIDELHLKLVQSQCANLHPNQYPDYAKLTSKEHFDLWDELIQLKKLKSDAENHKPEN